MNASELEQVAVYEPEPAQRALPAASLDDIPGSLSWLELPRMLRDPRHFLEERYARYGKVWKTRWVAPVVFVVGPEANRALHVTSRAAFSVGTAYDRLAFGRLFPDSLLLQDGDAHRTDRAVLQDGFEALHQDTLPVAAIWERAASRLVDGAVIDAHTLVRDVVFEVTARVLLGLGPQDDLQRHRELFESLLHYSTASLRARIPFGKVDRGLRLRRKLIALIEQGGERRSACPVRGLMGRTATRLSRQRHAEQVLLLLAIGYDTSAAMTAWLLHELARAPMWQERLAEEAFGVLGAAPPTYAELEKLSAHAWVVREIERLRPPMLFHPRVTNKEVEVERVRIPENTQVFYSPYLSHRIPEIFPDPASFNPNRWNAAATTQVPVQTALVGFGGGPRLCLGRAFALMHARVMLATLLRRFRMAPVAEHRFQTLALPTHRPKNSYLRLSSR